MMIEDNDDAQPDPPTSEHADEYEEEEDEVDADCPYSSIVSDLDLELETAALHLAIPSIPTAQTPRLTKTHAMVAVACANGSVKALCFPLAPPKDEDTRNNFSHVDLLSSSHTARAITAKILPTDTEDQTQSRSKSRGAKVEAELLVATVSASLNVCAVDVTPAALKKRHEPLVCSLNLNSPGCDISFHPSSRSSQMLNSDVTGAVRIYDPFALESPDGHLSGRWITSFLAPYLVSPAAHSQPARRKRVLDSAWILGGRGILALLEDGEWGVWDLSGSTQTGKTVGEFAITGFLGTAGEAVEPARSKKQSKLAPMTPNTRKAKSETLFGGSSKVAGAASTGGISVASNASKSGQPDESIVMWYGGEIYSIPSMQQFWQRSINSSSGFGSLYAPGMTHVSDINVMNETITSVSQLSNNTQGSSFGQMNTQRDLLVSAEHRLVITQTLRPSAPTRQLFEQAAERPVSRDRDQRMLDAGDLDLGGLNRMLDTRTENARPRRVGFAH